MGESTPPGVGDENTGAPAKKKSTKKKPTPKPADKPDVRVTQADIERAAAAKVTDEDIAAQAAKLMDRIPVTDNQTERVFGESQLTAEQALHIKRVKAGGAALCQIIINEVRNGEDRRDAIRRVRMATMIAVSAIANGT